jgi:hypothetical protein
MEDRERGADYTGTEALTVWVDALCAVPWPVKKWVVPTCE